MWLPMLIKLWAMHLIRYDFELSFFISRLRLFLRPFELPRYVRSDRKPGDYRYGQEKSNQSYNKAPPLVQINPLFGFTVIFSFPIKYCCMNTKLIYNQYVLKHSVVCNNRIVPVLGISPFGKYLSRYGLKTSFVTLFRTLFTPVVIMGTIKPTRLSRPKR